MINSIKIQNDISRNWLIPGMILLLCQQGWTKTNPKSLFQQKLEFIQIKYHLPGITAACIMPDGELYESAAGFSNLALDAEMLPEHRMPSASIGKMYVAAIMLMLQEKGMLNISDPIDKWLHDETWLRNIPNYYSITIMHLLQHTSGIGDYLQEEQFINDFKNKKFDITEPISPKILLSYIINKEPLFSPGESWNYSDSAYLLAGLIIEKASGKNYFELLDELILSPIQLNNTEPADKRTFDNLAVGYLDKDNLLGLPCDSVINGKLTWHPATEWTGGGMVSNSSDLAKWSKSLFESNLLSKSSLDYLLTGFDINKNLQYGLGTAIYKDDCLGVAYGHSGWIPGYCSCTRYYPDYKFAIAFQINTDKDIKNSSTDVIGEIQSILSKLIINSIKENYYEQN